MLRVFKADKFARQSPSHHETWQRPAPCVRTGPADILPQSLANLSPLGVRMTDHARDSTITTTIRPVYTGQITSTGLPSSVRVAKTQQRLERLRNAGFQLITIPPRIYIHVPYTKCM